MLPRVLMLPRVWDHSDVDWEDVRTKGANFFLVCNDLTGCIYMVDVYISVPVSWC